MRNNVPRRRWLSGGSAAAGIAALAATLLLTGASARDHAPAAHLLVVPDTPAGEAALAGAPHRVVARYASFTLVEAAGPGATALVRAGADLRDDMREVRIGTRSSDPTTARPSLLDKNGGAALASAGRGATGLAVVQYVGPIKDAWAQAVRKAGVHVVSYMAQNGQLVSGDDAALRTVAGLATSTRFVRAVTPYTAADKQLPGLRRAGAQRVVVETVAGPAGDAARTAVAAASAPTRDRLRVAGFVQQPVSLDPAKIQTLAALGGVVSVEPDVTPVLLDERAAQIVAGNLNASFQPLLGTGYLKYLSGRDFATDPTGVIDITDEGVDKGVVPAPAGSHPDFAGRLKYAQEATAGDVDARDCGGHGTNVASIAAGRNTGTGAALEDAQGFNYGLGISPFARIGATKIFNCAGNFDVTTSITALHSAAYAAGARVSNNSWGSAVGGAYNSRSQEYDGLVRDARPGTSGNQGFVEVVSAGNSGAGANTIGSPGTAKNVITVGADESVRQIGATDGCGVPDTGANSARDIIDFSSRGPTDDGRTKPDVVAPGTHVSGAQPQTGADFNGSGTCNPQFPAGSTLYTLVSGTSQAAPEATGLANLLQNFYRVKWGGGTTPASPAMTKALMVNTATNLAGGQDGAGGTNGAAPTQIQGWGRINLGTVLNGVPRQVADQKKVIGATGGTVNTFYDVASAGRPTRITLAFTDAVGPTVGNAFVNDLDLRVTAGGHVYKGNVLAGGVSQPGGTADPRDNVENVVLPAGVTGTVKVSVVGTNIAGDGVPGNADTTDQDYALVAANVGPAHATGAPLIETDHTVVLGGDGDATLEPGEPFTLAERLRNEGNVTATGIHGTATIAAGDGSVTQAGSTWPNLAPGAGALGTPPFGVTVAPSLVCGTTVDLTISVASSGGTMALPVQLPTGRPGSGTTYGSSDVPKAIPDNNPAGVTSTRTIQASGLVSDVNVTVGQITHTFAGDLTIDLISPAGTTVRLFNRNGGSGDNLTGTVFDDAATTAISDGAAPFTGTFRPAQPLSAFDGEQLHGTWKLKVVDNAGDDTGTLSAWSTRISPIACS
jgi:subtilisin-like proprotein convertase family protein